MSARRRAQARALMNVWYYCGSSLLHQIRGSDNALLLLRAVCVLSVDLSGPVLFCPKGKGVAKGRSVV
jgi:hypothetical protein